MKIDIITLFPGMVKGPLAEGIVGRAIDRGLLDVQVHDLRDYTTDRHRVVDDMPFGGGPGMVLKPEPLFAAVEHIREQRRREAEATDAPKPRRSLVRLRAKRFGETTTEPEGRSRGEGGSTVILTSPDGERLTHAVAERLSALEHIVVLCGRYEGVDERVRTALATETLSIGDYVLSGGELPALVIVDAIARFVPGVVGDEESVARDTFARGLLDYPQYTRPAEFRGVGVPPVLLSGHHAEIERWRRREALKRTLERRPELLHDAALEADDKAVLQNLSAKRPERSESE